MVDPITWPTLRSRVRLRRVMDQRAVVQNDQVVLAVEAQAYRSCDCGREA